MELGIIGTEEDSNSGWCADRKTVNAEECPCIVCEDTRNAHCTYEHRSCARFGNWLNNPSYDTEKVIEQLKEASYQETADDMDTFGDIPSVVVSLKKAVEIVRKGSAV